MEHNSLEVWKIIFLSKWVICKFHVNLPGFFRKIIHIPYVASRDLALEKFQSSPTTVTRDKQNSSSTHGPLFERMNKIVGLICLKFEDSIFFRKLTPINSHIIKIYVYIPSRSLKLPNLQRVANSRYSPAPK